MLLRVRFYRRSVLVGFYAGLPIPEVRFCLVVEALEFSIPFLGFCAFFLLGFVGCGGCFLFLFVGVDLSTGNPVLIFHFDEVVVVLAVSKRLPNLKFYWEDTYPVSGFRTNATSFACNGEGTR